MKKQNIFYRILCLTAALLLSLGLCMPAFADDEDTDSTVVTDSTDSTGSVVSGVSQSVIMGYSVKDKNGAVSSVRKGDVVTVSVRIRNINMDTEDCKAVRLTHVQDSFKGGSCNAEITSKSTDLLKYTAVFSNVVYTGKGQELSFVAQYVGTSRDPETINVTIGECAETETTTKSDSAPSVIISRGSLSEIKPGSSFSMDIFIRNNSDTAITNVSAVLDPGENLTLNETKTSKAIGTIAASSSAKFTVKLKADKKAESSPLTLGVSLKYTYTASSGTADGTAEDKLLIPITVSASASASKGSTATPNIIITGYSYGGSSVAAGDKFTLSVKLKNTSSTVDIENVVMAVQTGEAVSIASASNTYYIERLAAGAEKTVNIEMQALANAAASGGSVSGAKADITFSYEYVIDSTRTAANSNESLSIPVYLPDRFSVSEPETIYATAGEEADISIPYINRGKGSVSNVEAVITFENEDAAYCEEPKQQLGNFEAGKSGTIDFIFTPYEAGELKFTVTVSYEDEMTETKSVELPLTIQVDENMGEENIETEEYTEEEETTGVNKWLIIVPSVIAAVIIFIIIIVIIKKHKKKKAASVPDDFDWGDDEAEEKAPVNTTEETSGEDDEQR